jgi:glucose/arabinose dehydrogenase
MFLIFLFCLFLLPASASALSSSLTLDGLNQPVRLVAPAGDERLFVVEKTGRIRVFTGDGSALGVFLDIADQISVGGERGLLGLAFASDYATSGRFFVNYTDGGGDTRVVGYRADPASELVLLSVEQPFANHNGGHLEFGPDGFLYLGTGDGGSGGDPQNRAQNPQSLLGKMLRLDVSGPSGYAIPADNPFVGQAPRDEIWALGLRNPWCYGFDRLTGDLWIADVGQSALEEIDVQPAGSPGGENYGWRLMEGSDCYDPPADCNDGSLVLPVHEYSHGGSPFRCSISGGYVYRGLASSEHRGRYFYADYCSNQIWSLDWSATGGAGQVVDHTAELTPPGGFSSVVSIGQDGLGELYIVDLGRGAIYHIQGDTTAADDLPAALRLDQNVPNPFNPQTTISYVVPGDGTRIRLDILDAGGNLVRTLVETTASAGRQTRVWDGRNDRGREVAAGVYLYRLTVGENMTARKMALIR